MRPAVVAVGVLAALAGVGTTLLLRGRRTPRKTRIELSPRRRRVLQLLHEVIPSAYGDPKFKRLAPRYEPGDENMPAGFTTCGYLPCFIGRELGATDGITQCGLESMRTLGEKNGSWVPATGKNRPRPGDLYGIDSTIGFGPNTKNLIVHVGVIVDASGDTWTTADAGQGGAGDKQQALFVKRVYDPATVTLGGPTGKMRKLAGWIDIDKVPLENKKAQ